MNNKFLKLSNMILFLTLLLCIAITVTNNDVYAKESKVVKNTNNKIVKVIKYYNNGNIKQIVLNTYYKNNKLSSKKTTNYYLNKKKKNETYAKNKKTKTGKVIISYKKIKYYTDKGLVTTYKYYRYNTFDSNYAEMGNQNIYQTKQYSNGLLTKYIKQIYDIDIKVKVNKDEYIYSIVKGKNTLTNSIETAYTLNKRNLVKEKCIYTYSTKMEICYLYNDNAELKSNKYGNAYRIHKDNNKYLMLEFKYDSKGVAIQQGNWKEIPLYPQK